MKLKGIELHGTYKVEFNDMYFEVYDENDNLIYYENIDGFWAKKEYDEATKYGEQSNNSNRMKNLNEKYLDASYFLEIPRNLNERNVDKANENLSKIKDSTLKNIAQNRINNYSDINGHWAEKNIKLAMNNGWVTTSNIFRPNNSITRAEFITIVNNAYYSSRSIRKMANRYV